MPKKKNKCHLVVIQERIRVRRTRRNEKFKRHLELGLIPGGVIRDDGSYFIHTPSGIQNWYSTRELTERVQERMDTLGYCPINGKHQLQIRGKHMRRLLKANPQWEQIGRRIVMKDEKSC